MKIETAELKVTLTGDEARDIAYHIKYSLMASIKTHYNTLQQDVDGESVFNKQEKDGLRLMQEFFKAANDSFSWESAVGDIARLFEARRQERASNKS